MKKYNLVAMLMAVLLMSGAMMVVTTDVSWAVDKSYANPHLLLSADELKAKLDQDDDLVVLDVTGKVNYMKGHIPGAVKVEKSEIGDSSEIKNMKLSANQFAQLMEQKGISNDTEVVVYDHSGGLWATRVWWMAKVYGHKNIKLLDGGLKAWKDKGYDVGHFASDSKQGDYKVDVVNDQFIISTEEVAKKLNDPNFVMIDTRSDAEYNGEKTFGGADRKGHIPGAVHIEWNETLNSDGTLKSGSKLKKLYQSHGVTPNKEIAMHCHTAVRSAHTFFVLRLIGYPTLRNYDASWVGWANDHSLPVKK